MAVLVANPLLVHHRVVARRTKIIIPGFPPRQRRCALEAVEARLSRLDGIVTRIALDPEAERFEAAQLDDTRARQQCRRPRSLVVMAGAHRLCIAIIGLVEKWQ